MRPPIGILILTIGLGALGVAACRGDAAPAAAPPAPAAAAFPYDLVCDSSDTQQSSTLFCMRIDTRTGDVRAINLTKLPVSNGPTASPEGPAGTYVLVCDSTDTPARSEFRCLRMNRQTGELLVVSLPKVGVLPE